MPSLIKFPMYRCLSCLFILLVFIFSCGGNNHKTTVQALDNVRDTTANALGSKKKDSLKIVLKSNLDFFADSILPGNRSLIQRYIKRYQPDSCGIITYENSSLKDDFSIAVVRKITGGKGRDTVFVIPPFNYCDEGDSYCFTDLKLPRLYTESNCCHPGNLFVVDDIDEDGIREVGIYYSACTSRFKSLRIFSLKGGEWREIGNATFDIFTRDPDKVNLSTLVRKIRKDKFKICNFYEGKTTWETIRMK
jgi:hypothetical protein